MPNPTQSRRDDLLRDADKIIHNDEFTDPVGDAIQMATAFKMAMDELAAVERERDALEKENLLMRAQLEAARQSESVQLRMKR